MKASFDSIDVAGTRKHAKSFRTPTTRWFAVYILFLNPARTTNGKNEKATRQLGGLFFKGE